MGGARDRISAEKVFSTLVLASCLFLAAATYCGNKAIVAGHVFFLLALLFPVIACSPLGGWKIGRGKMPGYSWSLIFLVGILLVDVISLLAHWGTYDRPFSVLKKVRYLLIPAAFVATPSIWKVIRTNRLWLGKWSLRVAGGVLILVTVFGLIGLMTGFHPLLWGPPQHPTRLAGVSGSAMTYAYTLELSFLVFLGIFFAHRKGLLVLDRGLFLLTIAVVLVSGLGLYLSAARGAVLGVVVGLILIGVLLKSKIFWAAVVCVGLAGGGYAYSKGLRYFTKLDSENVRVAQWKAAGLTFLDHPALGVGYRQFENQCRELKKKYGMGPDRLELIDGELKRVRFQSHAHNNYLEAFASTGILGGLFLIGFCGFWLVEVWRKELSRLLFGPMIVGFLVSGFFENTFTDGEVLNHLMLTYLAFRLVDSDETAIASAVSGETSG